MLAAAIGWEEGAPELRDGRAVAALARTLNERHAAAKEAERASVALYADQTKPNQTKSNEIKPN